MRVTHGLRRVMGAASGAVLMTALTAHGDEVGTTRIATWKDNKPSAFLLMFDDGIPTHLNTVIPELKKRGFVGTFYLNPGVKWFQADKARWEHEATSAGMVFANHTFLHKGATNAAEAEAGIAPCNEYVLGLYPALKQPRLLSFCRPGGTAWTVPPEEMKRLYARYHLVPRPDAGGRFAGIHLKSAAALIGVVDQAIAKNKADALFFHGVGGDWLSQPKEDFVKLLDHLDACREKLWVTDPVSLHKYETERSSATVKVITAGDAEIRLSLGASTDPQLYDESLTLLTRVPTAWTACRVTQGSAQVEARPTAGLILYGALPGREEVVIRPVR